MDELTNGAAPAVTESAPAPVVTEQPTSTPSMEDTMSAVWDKMNPTRDDGGKFASDTPATEGADPAADVNADD
jgi:hypothetical protein